MKGIVATILVGLALSSAIANAAEEKVLTVTHALYKPYIWIENDVAKGIYVDVLTEAIENRLGLSVEFKHYPWKRAQEHVKAGIDDGFITVPTPERLIYSDVTDASVAQGTMALFTYQGNPRLQEMEKIQDLADLKAFTIITYTGNGWAEENLVDQPIEFGGNTPKSVLTKLALGRGDVAIEIKEVVLHNIKQLGLEEKVIEVPGVVMGVIDYKLMLGKESPYHYLLPKIDQTFAEMHADGSMDAIYRRYR